MFRTPILAAMLAFSPVVTLAQQPPPPPAHGEAAYQPGEAAAGAQEMDVKNLHPVALTCELFLRKRATEARLLITWAQGYMAGLNMGRLIQGDDARNTRLQPADIDHLTAVYCEQHPQDRYGFAVQNMYRDRPLVPGSQAEFQRRRGG